MTQDEKTPVFKNEDEERAFWATHDSVSFLKRAKRIYLKTSSASKTIEIKGVFGKD